MSFFRRSSFVGWVVVLCLATASGQNPGGSNERKQTEERLTSSQPTNTDKQWLPPGEDPENRLVTPFLKHLMADQRQFWTFPAKVQVKDLKWIVPFSAVTAAFIASDNWWSRQVPYAHTQTSLHISDYGAYALIGLGGSSFVLGHITHDDHLEEAGLLSGEAAINSTAVAYLFKGVTQRERPLEGNGNGSFFVGGSSFPSEHSAIAWSIASVWAHEYPGWLSQMLAYGLASTITVTRVTAKQHFPSDAIVGSALGWYFGRQVYRSHHDPELGGSGWGSPEEKTGETSRSSKDMGSPYVPLDSWIYPALDRLIAFGYVGSAYQGLRPWTRMECARLLDEASERIDSTDKNGGEAEKLFIELEKEFAQENRNLGGEPNEEAAIDSIYSRSLGISGTPLTDGFHFGQTIINDYGRPYADGFNAISGVNAHAVLGPVSVSLQGEYEHSPSIPSYPPDVLQAIATQDSVLPLPNGRPGIDRFQLLDSDFAVTFNDLRISIGKQSLDLGPGRGGGLLFSNNANPVPMLKIDQTAPIKIPGLSKLLGPTRSEFFFGQLSGQHWIFSDGTLFGPHIDPQPFIHGTKLSFKPTSNFEFGMGFTVLLGGPGLPLTWHSFFRSFYANGIPGTPSDPGDRRSTFDFTYRVPHLRQWLTIYLDSLVEDEYSPLGSTRPSMRLGVFLPQIPKVPKLELRLEGVYTDVPGQKAAPGFIYNNGRFRSGYTNNGSLLASWIGRDGRGGQAWATYWLSSRNKLQLEYRHQEVDKAFLQGGRINDFGGSIEWMLRANLSVSGLVQYEQWNFPILAPTAQSDIAAAAQLTFYPNWHIRK